QGSKPRTTSARATSDRSHSTVAAPRAITRMPAYRICPTRSVFQVAESVKITDNRTGKQIDIPIVNGGVSAADLSKLLPGVWFYDPAFGATAECESSITL